MPAAAIPLISAGIGAAGSLGSAAGGKKAQKQANQLAGQQLGLEKSMFGTAASNATPASNFWQSLLHGGQAAVQATGPIASQIGQAAQGARNSIAATMPRGGEANLATAQTFNDASNNIARLYAGMQPTAAGALGQLAGQFLGAGTGLGFPASMTGLGASQMGLQNAQAGAQGFGSLLYNGLTGLMNQGGGGLFSNFGSAPWVQGSIGGPSAVGPVPVNPFPTGIVPGAPMTPFPASLLG